ncbi:MAG: glucosyltransferase domain-containing protein [Lachnospiraceae bacterium]|nr:glucosyltransferase domain-containing protein [Lachnospiraceae bacterium]
MRKRLDFFWSKNRYRLPLILTAVLAYGFSLLSVSVGNDDTAIPFYYQEGQDVQMGRWTLFVLNKVFHFADYAPFFLELVGVLFLVLAASLFCVVYRRITEEDDVLGYSIFSCVFVSCPTISELNFYYTHNGVDMSFCLIALAAYLFDVLLVEKGSRKKQIGLCLGQLGLLLVTIGCCESMIIVYAVAILSVFYLRIRQGQHAVSLCHKLFSFAAVGAICILTVVLRNFMRAFIVWAFRLYAVGDGESWRSVGESLLDVFAPGGAAELKMLMKRFWLVYHVNAFVYLPIFSYAAACTVLWIYALVQAIRRRQLWSLLAVLGIYLAPFVLILAEWKVPAYRSAQFLPITAAFGMFVLYLAVRDRLRKWGGRIVVVLMTVLVFNQAADMNHSFYIEQMLYQNNCRMLNDIAVELGKTYNTNLPVVFRGQNETSYVYAKYYIAPYDSLGYRMVALVSDLVDPQLKEKYFVFEGYNYGVEIYSDFFTYAYAAFDNNSEQFTIFLDYLGYDLKPLRDKSLLETADTQWQEMPSWPAEGSIRQYDKYILIRVGNQ